MQLPGQDQDPELTKVDDIRKRLGIDAHLRPLQLSLEGASFVNDLTIYALARARLDEIHAEVALARLANQLRRQPTAPSSQPKESPLTPIPTAASTRRTADAQPNTATAPATPASSGDCGCVWSAPCTALRSGGR